MKLIAKVTLVTKSGEAAPGSVVDIKDADEAARLIALGFAEDPAAQPADDAPEGEDKPEGEGAKP